MVATAHGGTELATVVQTCGLAVPPEDAVALAGAVRTLAQDAALRERLGAASHLYTRAHLDRDAVCCSGLRRMCCTCWPKTGWAKSIHRWMTARLLLMPARKTTWLLLAVLLVFGTQMQGAWRDETLRATHLPCWLAGMAHFMLFAGLAGRDDWLADAVGIGLGLWVARGFWR